MTRNKILVEHCRLKQQLLRRGSFRPLILISEFTEHILGTRIKRMN